MAVDAIAIPGAPLTAGPPETQVGSGAPPNGGDGRTFSEVIASALEQPAAPAEGAPVAVDVAVVTSMQAPGVDLSALLAGGSVPTDGAGDLTTTPELRPDRDAEAEDVTAALAALMLGGVLPRPTPATDVTAGGVASTPIVVGVAASTLALTATASDAPPVSAEPQPVGPIAESVDAVTPMPVGSPISEYGWRPAPATTPTVAQPVAQPATDLAPVGDDAAGMPVATLRGEPAAPALTQTATQSEPQHEIVSVTPTATEAAPERDVELPRAERVDETTTATMTPYATPTVEVRAPQITEVRPTLTVDATDGPRLASRIADSVQAATLSGDRELRIALNPPDLGQLTVHITEHAEGGVTVAIHASSSEAHDLLQQQLPALRAGLEQREVRVERLQVEQQAPSAGLGWADSGQRRSNGGGDAWASRDEQPWSPVAAMGGVRSTATVSSRGPAESGRVDLRA